MGLKCIVAYSFYNKKKPKTCQCTSQLKRTLIAVFSLPS